MRRNFFFRLFLALSLAFVVVCTVAPTEGIAGKTKKRSAEDAKAGA